MEYPSRAVHEVCPYWLTWSEGLSANAGEHKTRKVTVQIAMSILAFMLGLLQWLHSTGDAPCYANVAATPTRNTQLYP